MTMHVAANKIQVPEVPSPRPPAELFAPGGTVGQQATQAPVAEQRPEAIPQVDPQTLEHAVNDIVRNVRNVQRSLQFSVDETSGRTIITVIDQETKEVIRQIPPEEILAIAGQIGDGTGVFLNEEA